MYYLYKINYMPMHTNTCLNIHCKLEKIDIIGSKFDPFKIISNLNLYMIWIPPDGLRYIACTCEKHGIVVSALSCILI